MHGKSREALLYFLLALALLLPRLPALGAFATLDEPAWLTMGANFYYALGQREFQKTVYEYQPAVTTMWVVTAGMLATYPEYRGMGQGYMDYEKESLDTFMTAHGMDPLVLLRASRLIEVVIITFLLLAAFTLLRRLVGLPLALASILLASLEPFFLGQSRLLNHEAMLVCFIAISFFSLAIYLFQDRRLPFLLLSGVSAGFAQLTKSSGIALLVPVGLLLLIHLLQNRGALWHVVRTFGLWLAALALTYVIFWPGMWVAPGKMLYEVYGNAFSFAFRGARLIALEEAAPAPAHLDSGLRGVTQQIYTILWRTPLTTWMGVVLAAVLLLSKARNLVPPLTRMLGWLAGATGLAFVLLFGVVQGRNSPHYVLTSYFMFSLLSTLGWYLALLWMGERLKSPHAVLIGMAALLLVQAGSALAWYPYYYSYQNPLLARLQPVSEPPFAYGEGLNLAARALGELPGAQDAVALSYYGRGCFSYFFPGTTTRFKPYYAEPGHEGELQEALEGADYLVLYPAVQASLDKYAHLFAALKDVKPVVQIAMDGYRYVEIYRVDSLTPEVLRDL